MQKKFYKKFISSLCCSSLAERKIIIILVNCSHLRLRYCTRDESESLLIIFLLSNVCKPREKFILISMKFDISTLLRYLFEADFDFLKSDVEVFLATQTCFTQNPPNYPENNPHSLKNHRKYFHLRNLKSEINKDVEWKSRTRATRDLT